MSNSRLGIVILSHKSLVRAIQVAEFWSKVGCFCVIHVDRSVSESQTLNDQKGKLFGGNIAIISKEKCSWGMYSMVLATIASVKEILSQCKAVERVILTSESCLPIKGPDYFHEWQAGSSDVDFIENNLYYRSASYSLIGERFQRFHFFGWKNNRWMFEMSEALQKKFNIHRKIPNSLEMSFGSQWWCLRRETLEKIIADLENNALERFFKYTWVPDEILFQTLVRRNSDNVRSYSLCYTEFDKFGKPRVFFDDHLPKLKRSRHLICRKVHPQADALYDYFLSR